MGRPKVNNRMMPSPFSAGPAAPRSQRTRIRATLINWSFKFRAPTSSDIQIIGIDNSKMTAERPKEVERFTTSAIYSILDAHTFSTVSGSIYSLKGPADVEELRKMGFSEHIVVAFSNGLPENWEELLENEWKRRNPIVLQDKSPELPGGPSAKRNDLTFHKDDSTGSRANIPVIVIDHVSSDSPADNRLAQPASPAAARKLFAPASATGNGNHFSTNLRNRNKPRAGILQKKKKVLCGKNCYDGRGHSKKGNLPMGSALISLSGIKRKLEEGKECNAKAKTLRCAGAEAAVHPDPHVHFRPHLPPIAIPNFVGVTGGAVRIRELPLPVTRTLTKGAMRLPLASRNATSAGRPLIPLANADPNILGTGSPRQIEKPRRFAIVIHSPKSKLVEDGRATEELPAEENAAGEKQILLF